MSTKLKNLFVRQIALVDKGANMDAMIVLAKRAPETETSGNGAQKVELTKESPVAEQAKEVEKVETLTTDLASVQKRNGELEAELQKVRADLGAEVETRTAELQASKAEVLKIQKARRRERFIKRCEDLDYLPGAKADDFAETLDLIEAGLTAVAPDRATKLFSKFNERLTAWNAVIEKNDLLFKEIGRNGGDLGMLSGVEAQMEVLVQEKMASDAKLTKAQAYDAVLKAHPQLYRKYQAEQAAKGGQ